MLKPATGIRSVSADAFARPASAQPRKFDPIYDSAARSFPLTDTSPGNLPFTESVQATMARTLHLQPNTLTDAYFSTANIARMQQMLTAEVKRRTGFVIGPQSADELLIIMRGIYADYADRTARDVATEVARLDRIVLSRVIDRVIANMTGYLAYLRDASRPREPIPHGVTTSTKGTKSAMSLFPGV